MDLSELVEIALANVEQQRVEVTALEPADVAKEAVGGLTQLITELVDNAIAFSGPNDNVGITGVFDRDDYLISISDNGVGIPETLLIALNNLLSDPDTASSQAGAPLGIVMVARLAARHGIDVRLVPAVPGTAARVTIPRELVSTGKVFDTSSSQTTATSESTATEVTIDEDRYQPGHVVAMTESARREAEAFLEKVFGPLRGGTASRRPTRSRSNGNGHLSSPATPPSGSDAPTLQTRVPGANFEVEDDDPSVISGEGAIDIRLNLSSYDEGRRKASGAEGEDRAGDSSEE